MNPSILLAISLLSSYSQNILSYFCYDLVKKTVQCEAESGVKQCVWRTKLEQSQKVIEGKIKFW